MSMFAKDAHKRVSKMVGYCLTLGDAESWAGLTVVLVARLSPVERASFAWSILRSLEPEQATEVFVAAVVPEPQTAMEKAAIEYRARRNRGVTA